MKSGWRRWVSTVLATAAITSAFWVILGGWFYYSHLRGGDRVPGVPTAAPANAPAGRLIIPVTGVAAAQLTDTFAQARANGQRRHDAIDIMAPEGTRVVAAMPGRVAKLFMSQEGGNTVYVRSADGTVITYYAHLRDYAPGLAEGQVIARDAVIGHVGHTGNADAAAPHLHFAMFLTRPGAAWSDEGTAIDPYPLLGGKLSGEPQR